MSGMGTHLRALDPELASVPGTVSAWCGPLGGPPAYARLPDATHYAASTMKVAVLAALHRADEADTLALDTPVPIRNDFASAAPAAPRFSCSREYDSDGVVWDRLDETVPLRWLAHRMIVRSCNLATNIVLSYVDFPAVGEVWRLAGARHSMTHRGIEDAAARDAGITNLVTAADLAALLAAIATSTLAGPDACREMLDVLFAQEHRDDLAAGLPPGTRIAHKGGWLHGVRHGAGVVFPDDAPPYALVVCTTTELASGEDRDDPANRLLARVAAASWADRAELAAP
jgi:beta-lactamase class A